MMTERERLIYILQNNDEIYIRCTHFADCNDCRYREQNECAIHSLADHLLMQRVTFKLPLPNGHADSELVQLIARSGHLHSGTGILLLADQLHEAGYRKQSEWISVEDWLPEEDTRVLVYLDIPKLDALTYTHCDTDRIFYGKWVRWGSYVTHWMPLPKPPKGE